MKRANLFLLIWSVSAAFPGALAAQDLAQDALSTFPAETIRVEYSSPARLRKLPNYSSLEQRYAGSRLKTLKDSLAQVGVQEGDVDDFILGWQAGKSDFELYGLASGRFDPKAISDAAAARGIATAKAGDNPAYCLGAAPGGVCVAVLGGSRGAFGPLGMLAVMAKAQDREGPALGSDQRFAKLLKEADSGTPIWGVAVGAGIGDWFRGWMPSQGNIQMDWSKVFQSVESLIYNLDARDQVSLSIKLNCVSTEAANNLRQMLEGLKLVQQLAWQNQNPNRANPFESVQVEVHDRRVELSMATNFSDLERAQFLGTP
jgi:hypothetical protein